MKASPARFDLVGVMASETALNLPADLGLSLVTQNGLALVLAPAGQTVGLAALLTGQAKKCMVEQMAIRQRLLERLHEMGDILPARPGQSLPVDHLRPALAANADALAAALAAIAGCAQYQIVIRWKPAAALSRFAKEPELAGLTEPHAIAQGAEALRGRLGTAMAAQVAESVLDHIRLPLDPGPETLANVAILTRRGGSATLDAMLEAIDGLWSDGLSIRMIGPLPAVSFVAFELAAPGPAAGAARRSLGLGTTPIEAEIRAALRARAAEATDLAALTAAAELLRRLERARYAAEPYPPLGDGLPLLRLLRDGDVSARIAGPSPNLQDTAA